MMVSDLKNIFELNAYWQHWHVKSYYFFETTNRSCVYVFITISSDMS